MKVGYVCKFLLTWIIMYVLGTDLVMWNTSQNWHHTDSPLKEKQKLKLATDTSRHQKKKSVRYEKESQRWSWVLFLFFSTFFIT